MKFKYYLRGIGIGIIFASIVFLVAYREYVPAKMTNEEIINRAKQLGMVEADEPINKLIDKKKDKVSTEEVTTKDLAVAEESVTTEAMTSENATTEAITTESTTTETPASEKATNEEATTEKVTTEATTAATTTEAATTEKASTEEKKEEKNKKAEEVEITISRGSSSYPVCQKLFELGLIDDAAKYDDYLIEKGYADRISVGTHKLKKGMDYHTIAELISDPLEE